LRETGFRHHPVKDRHRQPLPFCLGRRACCASFHHLVPVGDGEVARRGQLERAQRQYFQLPWTTPTLTEIAYTYELRELYRCEMLPAIDLLRGVVATSCIDLSLTKRSN
jgi:hypothetical protein